MNEEETDQLLMVLGAITGLGKAGVLEHLAAPVTLTMTLLDGLLTVATMAAAAIDIEDTEPAKADLLRRTARRLQKQLPDGKIDLNFIAGAAL